MTAEPQKPEHPSTYMVQDRSNGDELKRLRLQDQMLTKSMGGVLPEQADPTRLRRVLDVGSGTGGWLIELAKAYPTISMLAGADVSLKMIQAARTQAEEEGVNDRVEFAVMDALRMLDFPPGYFDLVNQRINFSYLRTWDWPTLVQQYRRVCRSGGIIRITEPSILVESNSPSLNQLADLGLDAFFKAGHLFTPGREGVIGTLPALLHQQGVVNVEHRAIRIEYSARTESAATLCDNIQLLFKTIVPFLRKWTQVPKNYEQIYQQALADMSQPGFQADYRLLTVWGNTP